jgi:SAM-dependent methyltransferase
MNKSFDPGTVAQYERETWSRCADSYLDTFAGLTSQTVNYLVKNAGIRDGSTVLEIGSGPGHVADQISHAGGLVTGVDFSQEMVSVAQHRYPNVRFVQADAEQLPFEDDTFDAVVANFVVHHLARPQIVFDEIRRVLTNDGRFAFVVWGEPEAQSSIVAFFAAVEEHTSLNELPHGPLFGVTDHAVYTSLLNTAGLTDIRLETHDVVWRCTTLAPVIRGFWDWGNLAGLDRQVQDKIESTTRINAEQFKMDGRYEFPHSVFTGNASKRSAASA